MGVMVGCCELFEILLLSLLTLVVYCSMLLGFFL